MLRVSKEEIFRRIDGLLESCKSFGLCGVGGHEKLRPHMQNRRMRRSTARKGKTSAERFLRRLYRERRLTAAELSGRLLDALAVGKLKPAVEATRRVSK